MMEEPIKSGENRRADGTFGPGNLANPQGRPKGISIKDRVRKWLEENPDDMEAFVKHFVKENKELAWQMLEGRPQQDLTSGGEKLPGIPIYGGLSVPGHDSDEKAVRPKKENS